MAMRFEGMERLRLSMAARGANVRAHVLTALRRGGLAIEGTAVESIMEQTPSGKFVRSRGNKKKLHEVSPAGSAPNADTGELHTSITSVVAVNTPELIRVETAANAPHAFPLEFGTSKMEPRPFMQPAFAQHRDEIRRSVEAAIRRGNRRR